MDTRAEEKGKVTLECETRRPAKRVTWLKGMVELRSGKKYIIKQKGEVLSLTITFLEKSDTDLYTCDVGTMQSRAHLTIQGKCVVHKLVCDTSGKRKLTFKKNIALFHQTLTNDCNIFLNIVSNTMYINEFY